MNTIATTHRAADLEPRTKAMPSPTAILVSATTLRALTFKPAETTKLSPDSASHDLDHFGIVDSYGTTRWESRDDGTDLYVEWEWVVLSGGVIAILDPHAIRTNFAVVDSSLNALGPEHRTYELAKLVQRLKWRGEVGVEMHLSEPCESSVGA